MNLNASSPAVNLTAFPIAETSTAADLEKPNPADQTQHDGHNGRRAVHSIDAADHDGDVEPTTAADGGSVRPPDRTTPADAAPDPFDPARLRLGQDFAESLGVKKVILTIPMRKPGKDEFVRVHPDRSYHIHTAVLDLKSEREIYLVDPSLRQELAAEPTFGTKMFFTSMNRQGVLFLWPVRSPGPDGRIDDWNRSALEAADMATNHWVRVVANMHLGAYDVFDATADLPAPTWPEISFGEILRIAFKDKRVDSLDHPVLKQLRGEQ